MKLAVLILVCLFTLACTPDRMEPKLPTTEFSPRHELRDIHVTGKIADYDPDLHGTEITMFGHPWLDQSTEVQPYFLEEDGTFSFTWRSNVIQDYFLGVGGEYVYLLLKPGSKVELLLEQQTEQKWTTTAPNDSFVNNSIRLLAELQREDTYEGMAPMRGPEADLETFRASVATWEKRMRARLDSAWTTQEQTDPYIKEWARQFVSYRMKRNLMMFPIIAGPPGPERDSLFQVAIYPDLPNKLEETSVVSNSYFDYGRMGDLRLGASVVKAGREAPKEDRWYTVYAARADVIKQHFTGFTGELHQARNFHLYLSGSKLDDRIVEAAREFLTTTKYPALREPLEELIATLTETVPQDGYQQRLQELPAGVDNPIPTILERHAGKVVVIDHWATWCGPCLGELEHAYPPVVAQYAERPVAFVFLARASQETLWRKYIASLPYTGDHYLTNPTQTAVVSKLFGVSAIPHITVFGPDGQLADAQAPHPGSGLEEMLDGLLGEGE